MPANQKIIRIAAGAGYSGDRIDPAVELAEQGDIQYLIFECLAERTIALAQQRKALDPDAGYDPLLEARFEAVLPLCHRKKIRIVTNMGAANPLAAARGVAALARELDCKGLRIAAITGDDVRHLVHGEYRMMEDSKPVSDLGDKVISANAYLGATPMVKALQEGADIVITGRVSDPALFLAPLMHEFNWATDDWVRLGRGTVVGHLLECAGQVTGGYFADPGYLDVPDLLRLGFPIAEVDESGNAVITKVKGSGGLVTTDTVRSQLLYEVHDPATYLQPDVIADFTGVRLVSDGHDRVRISGASGRARPDSLKVTLGYADGYVGEGQMSYAGPGALARGRLAAEIVEARLRRPPARPAQAGAANAWRELRVELIGVDAIHGPAISGGCTPYEVRLRAAARCDTLADALNVGREVEALYLNGPGGGGGATHSAKPTVAVASILIAADLVAPEIHTFTS